MKEVWKEIWTDLPKWGKYVAIGITVVFATAMFILAHYSNNYKKDNAIEQLVEEVLKEETGLDINLSGQLPAGK